MRALQPLRRLAAKAFRAVRYPFYALRLRMMATWPAPHDRRLLFVLHNSPFHDENLPRGGTEWHTHDLIAALSGWDCLVLYPKAGRTDTLVVERMSESGVQRRSYRLAGSWADTLAGQRTVAFFLRIFLCKNGVDLLHIAHWINLPVEIFLPPAQRIPYMLVLHDFYAICPQYNLQSAPGVFCGFPGITCSACALHTPQGLPVTINRWREKSLALLTGASSVIAPSDYVQRMMGEAFPSVPVRVVANGIHPLTRAEDFAPATPLCVAVLGHLHPSKGSRVLEALCRLLPDTIAVYHLGTMHDPAWQDPPHYLPHGAYRREDLPTLLSSMHLVLFPGPCPESFSYTLSEAWACGLPVMAFGAGAIGDRIAQTDGGWLVPVESGAQGLADALVHLEVNRDEIGAVRARVRNIPLETVQDMARTYETLYEALCAKTRTP